MADDLDMNEDDLLDISIGEGEQFDEEMDEDAIMNGNEQQAEAKEPKVPIKEEPAKCAVKTEHPPPVAANNKRHHDNKQKENVEEVEPKRRKPEVYDEKDSDSTDRRHSSGGGGRSEWDRQRREDIDSGYYDKKKLNRTLHVSKDTDAFVVGREIAYRLSESKMRLFGHVARVMGNDITMEIFEETKQLMSRGGLKTENSQRSRTPGGVFLYLLKSRYAEKEQFKDIFDEDQKSNKKAKKKSAEKRRKDRQKKEQRNKNGGGGNSAAEREATQQRAQEERLRQISADSRQAMLSSASVEPAAAGDNIDGAGLPPVVDAQYVRNNIHDLIKTEPDDPAPAPTTVTVSASFNTASTASHVQVSNLVVKKEDVKKEDSESEEGEMKDSELSEDGEI